MWIGPAMLLVMISSAYGCEDADGFQACVITTWKTIWLPQVNADCLMPRPNSSLPNMPTV